MQSPQMVCISWNPGQLLQCRSVESYLPALEAQRTRQIRVCETEKKDEKEAYLAFLHFECRPTKAGQVNAGRKD